MTEPNNPKPFGFVIHKSNNFPRAYNTHARSTNNQYCRQSQVQYIVKFDQVLYSEPAKTPYLPAHFFNLGFQIIFK